MTDLKKLAPCYLYDGRLIHHACRELKESLQGFDFLYSIKVNPFESIVKLVAEHGFGADAASLKEVDSALQCGIPPQNIFYSAPGKQERDLIGAWGKCVLVADSLHELELIQQIAASRQEAMEIGLRIHPRFSMEDEAAGSSKFGIDLEQLPELMDTLRSCPLVKPVGIHVHLKSQVLNVAILSGYYANVMKTAVMLQSALGIEMQFIDFGSGIGTVYDRAKDHPVDLQKLNEGMQIVHDINQKLHARLIIESGRYIVCRAGRYITPVVDKKTSHGVTYLIVANGMNGFLRPAVAALLQKACGGQALPAYEPFYTGDNAFEIRVLNDVITQETVSVVGHLCTAMDIIRENVTMNQAKIGDLIEISHAGSYAYSLSPLMFSSHELPGQYLTDSL